MTLKSGRSGGTDFTDAIVPKATKHLEGIQEERAVLAARFGKPRTDWELVSQVLVQEGGKQYDVMKVRLLPGERKEIDVYFDVTRLMSDLKGR